MSYGILKFKLPEEESEFKLAQRAGDYGCMLEAFRNEMRQVVKHGDLSGYVEWCRQEKYKDNEVSMMITRYWQHRLYELAKEYGINL